jgi:hypothetical protein
MEFQIPKFIERQPKIIGTITFKQFFFLAAIGGFLGLLYLALPSKPIFFLIALPTAAFSLALVFLKVGGLPLPIVLFNFLKYTINTKLYLWQKKAGEQRLLKKEEIRVQKPTNLVFKTTPKFTEKSYLKETARKIETGGL